MKKWVIHPLLWILAFVVYMIGNGLLMLGIETAPDGIPASLWHNAIVLLGCTGIVYIAVFFYVYWRFVYQKLKITISLPNAWMSNAWYPLASFVLFVLLQVVLPLPPSSNQEIVVQAVLSQPFFSFISVVIVAPVGEELLFRGVFAGYFFPDLTSKKAISLYILVTSTFFSLAHTPNSFIHFFIYFAMGAMLAWLYLAKRDIRYPMALHAVNNLLSFVMIIL